VSFISEISLTIIIALLKLKLHITTFTISSSYAKMKNKNIPYNYYFSPITRFTVSVLHTHWAKKRKIDTPHTGTHAHMYRRRTEHAMSKRKRYKRKNNNQQNTTQKTRSSNTYSEWTQISRRVSSSCSTCDTRRVILVTKHTNNHEWRKDRIVITNGTYAWSFATQIFSYGWSSHGGVHKTLEVMTST
jgi:DNA-directed RNA polymerase subunit M/transcription elongation factor TFIIS